MQFDFGENWKDYSRAALNREKLDEAIESISQLLPQNELKNKSVLDIGCGSGIFSLAFSKLGADRVTGTDINSKSVEASNRNLSLYDKDFGLRAEKISFMVDNILTSNINQTYDIVYSWGVLHHTGRMYDAIKKSSEFVSTGGIFIIAIYNKHWSSPIWKCIKFVYNISPGVIKKLMFYIFYPMILTAKYAVTGKNPLRSGRGMNFYYDTIDWIGGYPYEFASSLEIEKFITSRGFTLTKFIPARVPTGCNEFVFKKI